MCNFHDSRGGAGKQKISSVGFLFFSRGIWRFSRLAGWRCVDAWGLPVFWKPLEASCSLRSSFSFSFCLFFLSALSFCTLVEKRNLKSMSESMALHFSLPPAYRASAICGRARRFRCSSFFLSPSSLLFLVSSVGFLFFSRGVWGFSRLAD